MPETNSENHPYQPWLYLVQTLDPVHVGTGEFRLGRVDNTIVRDAGTNLPKIPGSSLAGIARAYAAMKDPEVYKRCAGRGPDENGQCGSYSCEICQTFGFSRKKSSFQGLAQFSDARLLFFPVYTLRGTMWFTSPSVLAELGVHAEGVTWPDLDRRLRDGHKVWAPTLTGQKFLNAGWLYFECDEGASQPSSWTLAGYLDDEGKVPALSMLKYLAPVLQNLAVVDDQVFPAIVEDQLEVRTSVSINPQTGTAADGALFTSEAIPRAAFLHMSVTTLNPKFFKIPSESGGTSELKRGGAGIGHGQIKDTAWSGLRLAEWMGIGGSGTRGMGRARITFVGKGKVNGVE